MVGLLKANTAVDFVLKVFFQVKGSSSHSETSTRENPAVSCQNYTVVSSAASVLLLVSSLVLLVGMKWCI